MLTMMRDRVKNLNFGMSPEIVDEFYALGNHLGEKNKLRYAVATAAVLALLEKPDNEIKRLISHVISARTGHPDFSLEGMIADAKAKASMIAGDVKKPGDEPPSRDEGDGGEPPQPQTDFDGGMMGANLRRAPRSTESPRPRRRPAGEAARDPSAKPPGRSK